MPLYKKLVSRIQVFVAAPLKSTEHLSILKTQMSDLKNHLIILKILLFYTNKFGKICTLYSPYMA
jgi:hypothetical protein